MKADQLSWLCCPGMQAQHCPGQWSYKVGPCQGIDLADQLWLSRYILLRVSEVCGFAATLDPNPLPGNWAGVSASSGHICSLLHVCWHRIWHALAILLQLLALRRGLCTFVGSLLADMACLCSQALLHLCASAPGTPGSLVGAWAPSAPT